MIRVTAAIVLEEREIRETFVRASGPGGQNVNKVSTAVQLRFDARSCRALSGDVQERLARLAGKRMTRDGVLIIESRRFRTQERNRRDALDRLVALIRRAAEPPRPRRKTAPRPGSAEARLESKRRRSGIKRDRGRVEPSAD